MEKFYIKSGSSKYKLYTIDGLFVPTTKGHYHPDLVNDTTELSFTIDTINHNINITISNPSSYTLHQIQKGNLYVGLDIKLTTNCNFTTNMQQGSEGWWGDPTNKDRRVRNDYHKRWAFNNALCDNVYKVTDTSLTYSIPYKYQFDYETTESPRVNYSGARNLGSFIYWSIEEGYENPPRPPFFIKFRPILISYTNKNVPKSSSVSIEDLFICGGFRFYAPSENEGTITYTN